MNDKKMWLTITLILPLILSGCEVMNTLPDEPAYTEAPSEPDTPRTLKLDGKTYDKYTLWGCRDYSSSFGTVLELVRIDETSKTSDKELTKAIQESKEVPDKNKKKLLKSLDKLNNLISKLQLGFIMFDGRKEYSSTFYSKDGIDHRWDWEDKYTFIIKPDGTGLYYDFTSVKKGESTKARDVYKCEKDYE